VGEAVVEGRASPLGAVLLEGREALARHDDGRGEGGLPPGVPPRAATPSPEEKVTGERFVVATVSGFSSLEPASGGTRPGLSAHVLDRLYNYALVASFRSEQRLASKGGHGYFTRGYRLGQKKALARAHALARELNERY
jgi:hypothetical protein